MAADKDTSALEISDIGVDSILEAAGLDAEASASQSAPGRRLPSEIRRSASVSDDSGGLGLSDVEMMSTDAGRGEVERARVAESEPPDAAAPVDFHRAPTPRAVIVPPAIADAYAADTQLSPDPNDFSLGFGDENGLEGLSMLGSSESVLGDIASDFFEPPSAMRLTDGPAVDREQDGGAVESGSPEEPLPWAGGDHGNGITPPPSESAGSFTIHRARPPTPSALLAGDFPRPPTPDAGLPFPGADAGEFDLELHSGFDVSSVPPKFVDDGGSDNGTSTSDEPPAEQPKEAKPGRTSRRQDTDFGGQAKIVLRRRKKSKRGAGKGSSG